MNAKTRTRKGGGRNDRTSAKGNRQGADRTGLRAEKEREESRTRWLQTRRGARIRVRRGEKVEEDVLDEVARCEEEDDNDQGENTRMQPERLRGEKRALTGPGESVLRTAKRARSIALVLAVMATREEGRSLGDGEEGVVGVR